MAKPLYLKTFPGMGTVSTMLSLLVVKCPASVTQTYVRQRQRSRSGVVVQQLRRWSTFCIGEFPQDHVPSGLRRSRSFASNVDMALLSRHQRLLELRGRHNFVSTKSFLEQHMPDYALSDGKPTAMSLKLNHRPSISSEFSAHVYHHTYLRPLTRVSEVTQLLRPMPKPVIQSTLDVKTVSAGSKRKGISLIETNTQRKMAQPKN
uniref:Uncharacterized protein n=1 Tax=Spongospora subterranea TaxID=70186 RepID=A0A0H5QXX6_9EUKA|eukprot:CRZ06823.1 hypothetical protein [Spongospora subterranea]